MRLAPPTAPSCTLVIFGASGDLTARLLMPALANLAAARLLAPSFNVIAQVHSPRPDEKFQADIARSVAQFGGERRPPAQWTAIQNRMVTVAGDFQDPGLYDALKKRLAGDGGGGGTGGNVLFYLAIDPHFFTTVAQQLALSGLADESGGWRRIVVEKPFGNDLASSRALNAQLETTFGEKRIYRIDHFLGKETVQNILVFRFANGMFEPVWNSRFIDQVQITVAETVGVESRGKFYDGTGALRDMIQNHLFQLLAMMAMEPPTSLDAEAIRNEKVRVLHSVIALKPTDIPQAAVRAQYSSGTLDGRSVVGYKHEPNVSATSRTETFAALRLTMDSWRWGGVPFYLRTGKRMAARTSEIAIQFKSAPQKLFAGTRCEGPLPNWLVMRIQPNEGISLEFGAKRPGPDLQSRQVKMDFSYEQWFGKAHSTGYETLLYEAMNGDQTLFQRADQVDAGWAIVQPVLDFWAHHDRAEVPQYSAGSWGPPAADRLLRRDGRTWRAIQPEEYRDGNPK